MERSQLSDWQKRLQDVIFQPLSALMRATCGELLDNPYSRVLMEKMAHEVVAAAKVDGVVLSGEVVNNNVGKPAALLDVEQNRAPNIDELMLPVVNMHREGRVSAPVCEAVYEMAKFKFSRWFHTFPNLAADLMVINGDKVLLIERKFPPYGWAIPGGMVDYGEKVECAAVRELMEETSIVVSVDEIKLLGIYSDPKRDSRGHTASAVYYAYSDATPSAADDAKKAQYFEVKNLPELAFDHREIIEEAINNGLFHF